MTPYKTGDAVEISHNGRTVEGTVILASSNGLSLMLQFEAMLGGHVGMMPVTMTDGENGFSIIDGTEVVIRRRMMQ